jgi:hypothetical protein
MNLKEPEIIDSNAPKQERLPVKTASALLAPQLADVLLRFEAELNAMEAEGRWGKDDVGAAIGIVDQPLWWVNNTMAGDRPGVHFEIPDSESVPAGMNLDAEIAKQMGSILDKAYVVLQKMEQNLNGNHRHPVGPEGKERMLRDVRYAANDLRRAVEAMTHLARLSDFAGFTKCPYEGSGNADRRHQGDHRQNLHKPRLR